MIVGEASAGSLVKLLDGITGTVLGTWSPFGRTFSDVSLAVGNLGASGKPEVVVARASLGSQVKILDGATGALLKSLHPFPAPGGGARVPAA